MVIIILIHGYIYIHIYIYSIYIYRDSASNQELMGIQWECVNKYQHVECGA